MSRIENQKWWSALMEHKDSLSLRELSARYGVPVSAIVGAFKRTGVRRMASRPSVPVKPASGPPAAAPAPSPVQVAPVPSPVQVAPVPSPVQVAPVPSSVPPPLIPEAPPHRAIPAPAAPVQSGRRAWRVRLRSRRGVDTRVILAADLMEAISVAGSRAGTEVLGVALLGDVAV